MDPMNPGPEDLNNGGAPGDPSRSAGSGAPGGFQAHGYATGGQATPGGPALSGGPIPSGGRAGASPAPSPSAWEVSPGDEDDAAAARPAGLVQLVCGDRGGFLVTVNPVDGCEVESCPPQRRPPDPVKRTAGEDVPLRPPLPTGPAAPRLPLLERAQERQRLVWLLSQGRSVRLTGPSGSGRSTLLDAVAEDCAGLAPDGVVRLCGFHRGPADLLHDLFTAVYATDHHRPDRDQQGALLRQIGAVVVLDDLEFGGSALDEVLDATPECAFLLATTPGVPAPSSDSHLEEVFLGGLGHDSGMELLHRTTGRGLTEEETAWAAGLWGESGGLPVRFVQAGALLRRRDQARAAAADPRVAPLPAASPAGLPLPPLAADGARATRGHIPRPQDSGGGLVAPLAALLGEPARTILRFAVALGGEVPHLAHLPALLADSRAETALGDLLVTGLITPVGGRYRLAAGVHAALVAAGFASDAAERAHAAGEHYAWWAGHRSVRPERVAAEADAVLATLGALLAAGTGPSAAGSGAWQASPAGGHVPGAEGSEGAQRSLAVRVARTAAPAFAAALDWSAWERALRGGQEAARTSGEVADDAYFHHELGVLALCQGHLDRARTELEASIGLKGVLADKRGSVAGRRALALVADTSGTLPLPRLSRRTAMGAAAVSLPDASGRGGPAGPSGGGGDAETARLRVPPGAFGGTVELPSVAGPAGDALPRSGQGPGGLDVPGVPDGPWAPGVPGRPEGPRGPGVPGGARTRGTGSSDRPDAHADLPQTDSFAKPDEPAEPVTTELPWSPRARPAPGAPGAPRPGGPGPSGDDQDTLLTRGPAGPGPAGPAGPARPGGRSDTGPGRRAGHRRAAARNTKRNLVAASAGGLLIAVLGTVVTLGITSNREDDKPSTRVGPAPGVSQDDGEGVTADGQPPSSAGSSTSDATDSPSAGDTPSASDSPTPSEATSSEPEPESSTSASHSPRPSGTTAEPPTHVPPTHKPPTTQPPPSKPPTSTPSTTPPSQTPPGSPPPPGTSNSAGGPAPAVTVTGNPAGAAEGSPSASVSGTPSGTGSATATAT